MEKPRSRIFEWLSQIYQISKWMSWYYNSDWLVPHLGLLTYQAAVYSNRPPKAALTAYYLLWIFLHVTLLWSW
jgi:hypothetical protein